MAGQAASSPSEAAGRETRFRVTLEPLDPVQTAQAVASPDCGAVATFVGLVRDHNARPSGSLARLRVLRAAGGEIARADRRRSGGRWPGARLAIAHRVGSLQIGEASVVIAAASPHRADAFAACRYAIERIKQIAPIWKHEHFDGGDIWIEGATADPDDEAARRIALERAGSDQSRDGAGNHPPLCAAAGDRRRRRARARGRRAGATRRPRGTR